MLQNYLKIAWRTIQKYRGYSLMNILGLSLGIAIFFLCFILVSFELSFDRFHEKAGNIYRVHQKFNDGGTTARVSYPIKDRLMADYSQIENATSFSYFFNGRVVMEDRKLIEDDLLLIEPTFFDFFNVNFIKGDKTSTQRAFSENRNDAILTEETAKRLFGEADPMGKSFTVEELGETTFIVSGVVEKFPANSHFTFNMLLPLDVFPILEEVENNFNNPVVYTYLYIPDQSQALDQDELDKFIARHFPERYGGKDAHLPVIAMTDIHLNSSLYYELGQNSSVLYVSIVGSIGFLILVLACINFTNLTTARAARRAREVGMRKALGAARASLVKQFIGEAVVISFIAVFFGVIIAELLLPLFNLRLGRQLVIDYYTWYTIPILISIGLGVGILSGSYPAFFLSSFNPVKALKGDEGRATKGILIREGLVVIQFVVVTFLLITILSLKKQLNYIATKDLGYNYENLIFLRSSDKMIENEELYQAFTEALEHHPQVEHVAGFSNFFYNALIHEGMDPNARKGALTMVAGPSYIEAMGMELVAGRFPSRDIKSDSSAILFNETAIREFGWEPVDAIGKTIDFPDATEPVAFTIIGVLKDFHLEDLTIKIQAMAIIPSMSEQFSTTCLQISPENKDQTVADIQTLWERYDDGWPFQVFFMRDGIEQQYEAIVNLNHLMQEFTYLAIFIACMGLFGLAAFSAERRTKEIGIRKALGATIGDVWQLMVREFFRLVLAATLIGSLLGFFIVSNWMINFAYRTNIGVPIYVISIILATGIAVITVSYQAIKSARVNPVKSLRVE